MCTVVLLIRPGDDWPVLLAANRDERLDRAWDPPAAHWPEHPGLIAGRDRTAGGTWMGVNRRGVAAAVLNRQGSLGPAPGKRSRGGLPLLALRHDTARGAANAITGLDAGQWRGFNLVLADRNGAVFVRGLGHGHPQAQTLSPGVHMVTAHDPDDPDSPRVARHLAKFAAQAPLPRLAEAPPWLAEAPPRLAEAPPRRAGSGWAEKPAADWGAWPRLLADRSGDAAAQINVVPRAGFGTVCSSLLALSAEGAVRWLFASGPPHEAPFLPVRTAL